MRSCTSRAIGAPADDMKRSECIVLRVRQAASAFSSTERCSVGPAEYQVGRRSPNHSCRSTLVGLDGNATLPPVISGGRIVVVSACE